MVETVLLVALFVQTLVFVAASARRAHPRSRRRARRVAAVMTARPRALDLLAAAAERAIAERAPQPVAPSRTEAEAWHRFRGRGKVHAMGGPKSLIDSAWVVRERARARA